MADVTVLLIGHGQYAQSIAQVLRDNKYTVREIESSTLREMESTTDLVDKDKLLLMARKWISKNSLRDLDGRNVKVVYTVGSGESDSNYCLKYMHVVRFVFKRSVSAIVVVAEDKSTVRVVSERYGKSFAHYVPNVVIKNVDEGYDQSHIISILDAMRAFTIKVGTIKNNPGNLKVWSSEKVILFGRTGSGKSTIAHMLTRGDLHTDSEFVASSRARGMTKKITRGEGRGWHVTDTPGFGEAREGTVPTPEATIIIRKFVTDIGGEYSHYIYVVRKDRLTVYDQRLWKFFKQVFLKAEKNFTVVVTDCQHEMSAEDEAHLRQTFPGCESFLYVDFCPIDREDEELEDENKDVRRESLQKLEKGLANLGLADTDCFYGAFSKESLRVFKKTLKIDAKDSLGDHIGGLVSATIYNLLAKPATVVAKFARESKIDEDFMLLPQ